MATTLVKQYIYQAYGGSGHTFLKTLQNVKSEFSYSQNMNSAGAQLEIVLGNSFDDVGAVQTDEFWVDESGNKTIDGLGNHIVWDAQFDFNNVPIDLGNRIKVYASYDGQALGAQVFDGFISKWQTNYTDNTITLTVLSWGAQLDNYLITTDPTGQSIDQEVYDMEYTPTPYSSTVNGLTIAQSFNIATNTLIGSFIVLARASAGTFVSNPKTGETITPLAVMPWELYAGTPTSPGSLIDSGQVEFSEINIRQLSLQLGQPKILSGNYFLAFYNGTGGSYYYADPVLEATATNPYAGGSIYTGSQTSSGITYTAVAGNDLAFIVQSTNGNNTLSFVNQDPSVILERIIDQLVAQGGLIDYTTTSIDVTASSVTYGYKIQTILEGIQKILQLSPDGWYWYIDVGTNTIHFHRTPSSANHIMVLGNHLASLDIEYSLEQVINTVYFSGGDTGGGVNLYVAQKDAASSNKYGQWLERLSDNRVTLASTAAIITSGEIGGKTSPIFHTTADILAAAYDIESFNLGQMVAFRGFGNVIDTLLFQIVALTRYPDKVTLSLGTLPQRSSSELENVKRRLDLLETIDNPSNPS